MAVGKRRTRSLVLGGRRYRWRCDFNHPLEIQSVAWAKGRVTNPDRLFVRPEDGPHQLLTVSWPPCAGPLVTPGLVRACVEEALQRAWPTNVPVLELGGGDVPSTSAKFAD